MNHRITFPLLAALGALALGACGSAAGPVGSPAGKAPEPAAHSDRGAAGVKVFIDPATGELRAPTEAEQQHAAAAAAAPGGSAAVKATVTVEGKPIGNGMYEYDLGKRGVIDEVACVQADGTISGKCPKAAK
jgi:hypothetical protein